MSDIVDPRARAAEEIIRAQNRLIHAMYNGDDTRRWPWREPQELQRAYENRYGVRLGEERQGG